MASKPRIIPSTNQGRVSVSGLSQSSTGSLPIRAPITLDDESSDFESDGHRSTDNSDIGSIDNESESEGFSSAEEFETASERHFVGDPEEQILEESDGVNKFQLSRPFVGTPGEEGSENSVSEEEESDVTDEYNPVGDLYSPISGQVRPIAQLSMDDDESDGLVGDEDMVSEVEDGSYSGTVKVPVSEVLERVNSSPRVKMSDVEEDELLVQRDSSIVDQSKLFLVSDLDKLFEGGNSILHSKDVNHAVTDCVSVGMMKDEGFVDALESQVETLVETQNDALEENPQVKKEVKRDGNESVSVELVEDEAHFQPLVGSIKSSLKEELKLDNDVWPFGEQKLPVMNLEQEKIELTIGDLANHASEQSVAARPEEQIHKMVNSYPYDTKMNSLDEIIRAEYRELNVEGIRVDADASFIRENVAFEEVGHCEKLEVNSRPETGTESQLPLPEDAIVVESMDNHSAVEMNELQTVSQLESGNFSEALTFEDTFHYKTSSINIRDEGNQDSVKIGEDKKLLSDEDIEYLIYGGNANSLRAEASHDQPQIADQQTVMVSDEEVDTEKEHGGKRVFDSAALAALLRAATGAELDQDDVTITSADGSRVFSIKQPAGSGSLFHTVRPALAADTVEDLMKENLSEEEKKMIEEIHNIRVKFLRLVQRLGLAPNDAMAAQVLHRLALAAGGHVSQEYSLESSKRMALQLESEGKDDLDFSLTILVLGKTGVGKSATINSLFGEKKAMINAFEPATTRVKDVVGAVGGVRIRIIDTPGLRSAANEEPINRKILASIKKFTEKFPPDVVLYVDRLDTHARDFNDLPLLRALTNSLTASIWRNAVVTLTHAASPPPDGPSGSPLSFEVLVAQRSRIVQQAISQAVGDLRLMHPSMMHPVSLVENHPLCLKNENHEPVLPNGQNWRPQLLLLCYSLKILSEAGSHSKPQDPFDHKKLFGFRSRSLPLPHLVSSLLQSRAHPKFSADTSGGGGDIDSDIELVNLSDSDDEDEDEFAQLPPFKPLGKALLDKLSKEQKNAYFEEYDYRVKLLQKKRWREEVKMLKEIRKRGKDNRNDRDHTGEELNQEDEGPATVSVPMLDFVLPPSFDSDNVSYRYRGLEPTSQLLVRPVLDPRGWDHDCGYDGISIEKNLATARQFPGAFAVQITKDKKEFNIHLDSSICAKHGENGSTMVGFDIQHVGRQLAYILRSETKLKHFKINKTSGGISITLLDKNMATGVKLEDQIAVGKRLALVCSAGAVKSGRDTAYGANFEVRLKSKDFPVEQDQSTLDLSLMKWRGDLGLMANIQSQFSIGRNSKVAVRIGMNNKQSGQITIKTSSSEMQTALIGIVPIVISVFRSIYPGCATRNSNIPGY